MGQPSADWVSTVFLNRDEAKNRLALLCALCLLFAAGGAGLAFMLTLPGDPKNALLFGLSAARWLMLAGMLLLAALSAAGIVLERRFRCLSALLKRERNAPLIAGLALVLLLTGTWFFNWMRASASDRFLRAYLERMTPFAAWICCAALLVLLLLPLFQPRLRSAYAMLAVSVLLTGLVAAFTNHYRVEDMPWDVKYFYLLAERGFGGENISPYVYRFGNPFLARAISQAFFLPVYSAYVVVSWLGGILQLFSLHLLISHLASVHLSTLRPQERTVYMLKISFIVMTVIAFTTFNLKYLLFDVSRPDQLAYGLLGFAMLALLQDRTLLCGLLGALGLPFREYLALPPFLLSLIYAKAWLQDRRNLTLILRIAYLGALTAAAILLPRLLIDVSQQTQFVDPQNPATLRNLLDMPLNMARNLNLLFSIAAYFLPLWLLITPARLRLLVQDLKSYRFLLVGYAGLVFIMTLYGGHDMPRYISYMSIPLLFCFFFLGRQNIPRWEWIYLLAALALFNRTFAPIPGWDLEAFLDYYGAYGERLNHASLMRWLELCAWIAGMIGIRLLVGATTRENMKHGHPHT